MMIKTLEARFDDSSSLPVKTNITPQYIYQSLLELPNESLAEIWEFIEFMRYKKQRVSSETPSVKLGGLLRDFNVDITENDIARAREEMWSNLGELNE